MNKADHIGLNQFLIDYPGMSIAPTRDSSIKLKGLFAFSAKQPEGIELKDTYKLQINISASFPKEIPEVIETGNKIPRDGKHHVNSDGTLCLGAPLSLLMKINKNPTLTGFAKSCLVPYLYAVSHKLQLGGDFIFGELDHGDTGLLKEYKDLFGLVYDDQVKKAFYSLGLKKRIANKKLCPCGCGKRLGRCQFRKKLNIFRHFASRSWYKSQMEHFT